MTTRVDFWTYKNTHEHTPHTHTQKWGDTKGRKVSAGKTGGNKTDWQPEFGLSEKQLM